MRETVEVYRPPPGVEALQALLAQNGADRIRERRVDASHEPVGDDHLGRADDGTDNGTSAV